MIAGSRVLVTGACGFSGRHLVRRLREFPGLRIIGLDCLPAGDLPLDKHFVLDLGGEDMVADAVERARPDLVFHLAGLLRGASLEELRLVNFDGFVCLCRALRHFAGRTGRSVRMVTVGSAAEIGPVDGLPMPLAENVPCRPETPYGKSKWEATRRALAEPAGSPLAIVVARPFNLIGPGLPPQLSLGNFARQIAAVVAGTADAVRCGPLDARRDFVDVRDAVDAYIALAVDGRRGEIYNVCSGRSHRIGDLLEAMRQLAGVPVAVESMGSAHAAGVSDIVGDASKIHRETGWEPRIPIEQSLADLLSSVAIAPRCNTGTCPSG